MGLIKDGKNRSIEDLKQDIQKEERKKLRRRGQKQLENLRKQKRKELRRKKLDNKSGGLASSLKQSLSDLAESIEEENEETAEMKERIDEETGQQGMVRELVDGDSKLGTVEVDGSIEIENEVDNSGPKLDDGKSSDGLGIFEDGGDDSGIF